MNFNHDTGAIDTILTIDTTTLPPLGGTAGVLNIIGNGGIQLPVGPTAGRPANSAGLFRYNTDTNGLEYNNGTAWNGAGGTVTSVAVSGSTGLSVSGSPVTTSGTITLTLGTELQGLSALASNGVIARTAVGTYTNRTITGTASNITVTNGDGVSGNPTINLATVTDSGTGNFRKIAVDTYGRVSGTAAVAAGDITTALGYTPVNKTGDTMSGTLTFSSGTVTGLATPSNATDAATKSYVDSLVQGLDPKGSVRAATTEDGALSTAFAAGQTIDNVLLAVGDRILIKDQNTAAENGIYVVQASGAPLRATDMDSWLDVPGAFVFVEDGTANSDTGWVCTSNQGGTLGSTDITWSQFAGAGSYTAGNGLSLTGTEFSLLAPVTVNNGGTGLTALGAANQILGVNSAGGSAEYKTVTAGTAISVTHGAGTITVANTGVTSAVAGTGIGVSSGTGAVTISNTGVTSITGTANQITASASTGSVTLSLPASVTTTNLTLSGLTANTIVTANASKQLTSVALTNGQLLIGSTGNAPVAATITAGTGISVSNGAGTITIGNTGVTSVGLSLPSIFDVTGSPVTTTGTLTATLASQTANTVFAGPSGSAGAPSFRSLVYADLPIKMYTENYTSGSNTASGTNSIAFGTGASATLYGQKATANGSFAVVGDAQTTTLVVRNQTTNSTTTELFLDGSSQRVVVPNNAVWTFDILVAGRRTDATGGGAGYRFTGVLRKDTTNASITFVGTPSKQVLGETNTIWNAAVVADTTNGSLRVDVTGEASKTIRWVATIVATQVTN